ncbi:selenide, water dikinase SelD [Candidatus Marinimicrobia bacterium MT.SAG.3]|nr:selenide, water dikinase SelD [Candidatus Marinimicrobia bacterium MT.SAG.3]
MPTGSSENLIIGFDSNEDAAVYRITDETALVQTADYITPMTDDPYLFGQLAAANALSDIYAMGAKPITAINLCNFPGEGIPNEIFSEILNGGASKVLESGAVTVGGHTIKDDELKYGLSVSGIVHPDKVVRNSSIEIGDSLILSKPVGTGVLFNGVKKGALESKWLDRAVQRNVVLNKKASELMLKYDANACTDLTGFGLLGHLNEMVSSNDLSMEINALSVPYFEKAIETSEQGYKPGMSKDTMRSLEKSVSFDSTVSEAYQWLLVDPQTSGGLIISIPEERTDDLLKELKSDDSPEAAIIGKVTEPGHTAIMVVSK